MVARAETQFRGSPRAAQGTHRVGDPRRVRAPLPRARLREHQGRRHRARRGRRRRLAVQPLRRQGDALPRGGGARARAVRGLPGRGPQRGSVGARAGARHGRPAVALRPRATGPDAPPLPGRAGRHARGARRDRPPRGEDDGRPRAAHGGPDRGRDPARAGPAGRRARHRGVPVVRLEGDAHARSTSRARRAGARPRAARAARGGPADRRRRAGDGRGARARRDRPRPAREHAGPRRRRGRRESRSSARPWRTTCAPTSPSSPSGQPR